MFLSVREIFEYGIAFVTIFITVFFLLIFMENRGRMRQSPKPPKALPGLTILIPAYNEQDTIAGTIGSALAADYARGRKEIIVIDDGSKDATLRIARGYERKGVLVLHRGNAGKAAALNYGLTKVKTELVATLDSDSYIEKDALLKMVGYFKDPEVGAVTSVMKVWEPRNPLEKLQRLEYLLMVFSRRLMSFIDSVNVTPGPLSMFRKKVFDEIGGYDEKSILEDQELAMRMQAHHYRIAASMDAIVHTVVPRSLGALAKQRVRWQRGGVRNILKHYYLMNPKYGDFGMVMMPISILSVLALFLVFFIMAYYLLNGTFGLVLEFGPEALWLGLRPLHVISLIILLCSVVWAVIGLRQLRGEALSPLWLVLYVLFYAPVITFFWIITAFKELKMERLRW